MSDQTHTDHCRDYLCQGCEEIMRDEASITEDNVAHDTLCRGIYQRYTDPKHCASCDLIWAVREDDKRIYSNNIGRLEEEYRKGYSQAIKDMTPECTCGIGKDGSYLHHQLPCRYGSFTHSQEMR